MMCPEPYRPEEIAETCSAGGKIMHEMIRNIVKTLVQCTPFKKSVINYVRFHGGSLEEGEEIFMDSIMLVSRKLMRNEYKALGSVTSFAYGICKNKWQNERTRKKLKTQPIDEKVRQIEGKDNVEESFISEETRTILWSMVEQQKGNCSKFLKYWSLRYSNEEIAELMNMEESNVRQRTYKCRKKLKAWIKKHPKYKELLEGVKWDF